VESSGDHWRLGHRPGLDGLRGIAILLVLSAHLDNPKANPLTGAGIVGVTVFFTLSGFLITALLLGEHDRAGRVSMAGFYRRRAFRLLPALFAVLLAVAVVQTTWKSLGVEESELASVLFYWSNWYQIAHPGLDGLSHTWSLAVEEQFYLLWPPLLLLGARWGRRGVSWIALIGLAVSVASVLIPGGPPVTRGSLEQACCLLSGCLLAVWMSARPNGPTRPAVAVGALVAVVPFVLLHDVVPDAAYVLAVPVVTVVVLGAVSQGGGASWLSGRTLGWFGRRSYGIYLWHYPVLATVALNPGLPWWGASAVLLAIALACAEMSWRLIEAPAQRLGRGWRPATTPRCR
jgi:peptidoglycan/LPS O-acetylase OafA/YrhL